MQIIHHKQSILKELCDHNKLHQCKIRYKTFPVLQLTKTIKQLYHKIDLIQTSALKTNTETTISPSLQHYKHNAK